MSWIVETLLLNRHSIKEGVFVQGDFSEKEDLFLDCLHLEKKINEMNEKKMFTPYEISILEFVMEGDTYSSLGERLGMDRGTISMKFRSICKRIAFYIGGTFTDEGYVNYMKEKYNLRTYQVELLISYMNSRFRHTVRRTPYDGQHTS